VLFFHIEADTLGDGISSKLYRCLDIVMSPGVFFGQRIEQPPDGVHFGAPFTFLRIIKDKVHGFSLLGGKLMQYFQGFFPQGLFRILPPHMEKVVKPCPMGEHVRIKIPMQGLDVPSFP